ncbi:MAG: class I SAM-dependent methyltransferase [Anaerolineales bacterium]|nr:class I SAM-dependent methyltransferase [Anaerolineales bacterium]
MDLKEYDLMYQVETRHWWYLGMAALTRVLLKRWVSSSPLRILDAGCGTGSAMTTYLAEHGKVTGVDLYPQALTYCQRRKASRLACASVLDLPLASASFDLVATFDVLYERGVSDELKALREFSRVLVPHGKILLRLPAYDWLRGSHDARVHTQRRYTKSRVKSLLEQSGFRVEHLTYANMLLFPLALIKRLSERLTPQAEAKSDLSLPVGPLNGLLKAILASEAPLVANFELPYGLSVIALGRKEE